MQIYELTARFDARASFYGKARVLENRGRKVLVAGGGAAWWRAQPVEAFGWPEFFAGALA